jgi:hypothetical protein
MADDRSKFRLADPQEEPDNIDILASFPTGVGDAASALLAVRDIKRGNYGQAFLNGLGVIPFIPSMGGTIKNVGGALSSLKNDLSSSVDRLSSLYKAGQKQYPYGSKMSSDYYYGAVHKDVNPKDHKKLTTYLATNPEAQKIIDSVYARVLAGEDINTVIKSTEGSSFLTKLPKVATNQMSKADLRKHGMDLDKVAKENFSGHMEYYNKKGVNGVNVTGDQFIRENLLDQFDNAPYNIHPSLDGSSLREFTPEEIINGLSTKNSWESSLGVQDMAHAVDKEGRFLSLGESGTPLTSMKAGTRIGGAGVNEEGGNMIWNITDDITPETIKKAVLEWYNK